jgi:hypothetical protein
MGAPITLVLGSGISVSRKVPDWVSLARDLWDEAFPEQRLPWDPKEGKSPFETPAQFLPIVFELAEEALKNGKFVKVLQTKLYQNASHPMENPEVFKSSNETLAVLARKVVQEFNRGPERRIGCIVTLNADDMLEQAVSALVPHDPNDPETEVIRIVERPSREVFYKTGSWLPISLYHIHGFLPSGMQEYESSAYMLVFTDAQYWSTSATALSFANRVMAAALSEGPCIFIGLSMTDINLLRWLALRALEWNRDVEEEERLVGLGDMLAKRKMAISADVIRAKLREKRIRTELSQHFWIRPPSADPTGLLTKFLEHRGIRSVELEDWSGPPFQRLMQECFPEEIPDKCRIAAR